MKGRRMITKDELMKSDMILCFEEKTLKTLQRMLKTDDDEVSLFSLPVINKDINHKMEVDNYRVHREICIPSKL